MKRSQSSSVTALKLALGARGRADFVTHHEELHADLVWPDERVSVWVQNCIWLGCPKHCDDVVESWVDRIAGNVDQAKVFDASLIELGWSPMRFYECEVANKVDSVAEKIMAVLHQHAESKPIEVARNLGKDRMALARYIRVGILSDVSDKKWREILELVSGAGRRFKKAEIRFYLVERGDWSSEEFGEVWDRMRNEKVIIYTTDGFLTSKLFDAVMKDAGVEAG